MIRMFYGDVIETDHGPATIVGCDTWPNTFAPNKVAERSRVSAVTDDGTVVIARIVGGTAVAA